MADDGENITIAEREERNRLAAARGRRGKKEGALQGAAPPAASSATEVDKMHIRDPGAAVVSRNMQLLPIYGIRRRTAPHQTHRAVKCRCISQRKDRSSPKSQNTREKYIHGKEKKIDQKAHSKLAKKMRMGAEKHDRRKEHMMTKMGNRSMEARVGEEIPPIAQVRQPQKPTRTMILKQKERIREQLRESRRRNPANRTSSETKKIDAPDDYESKRKDTRVAARVGPGRRRFRSEVEFDGGEEVGGNSRRRNA